MEHTIVTSDSLDYPYYVKMFLHRLGNFWLTKDYSIKYTWNLYPSSPINWMLTFSCKYT